MANFVITRTCACGNQFHIKDPKHKRCEGCEEKRVQVLKDFKAKKRSDLVKGLPDGTAYWWGL